MLRSYFKLAYRNIIKNKLSSIINITGLSVAIGCSILFFLLLDMEYTSDRFHENSHNIFMVGYTLEGDQNAQRWGDSPQPLGPALETQFPQVERSVRITDKRASVRYENNVFDESIRLVEPDFLDMFSFPLKSGNRTALSDKNAIILSEPIAEKYFGEENPIGKKLELTFDRKYKESYIITGVAEKFPFNASFSFDFLASFELLDDIASKEPDNWGNFIAATFIQVNNPADIPDISGKMEHFLQRHNVENIDRPIAAYIFEPLPTLSWESQNIRRSISSGSTPEALIIFFVIGIFLLIQACSNYVNISLASATRRLKEIGIRKVVGSQRLQLIKQFLGENLLLCFTALVIGVFLTKFVFIPGLFEITGQNEEFSLLEFLSNSHLWGFFVILLLITGFGAGIYPALFISKLQPVKILKGRFRLTSKKRFTGVLLSLQFGITFLIMCLVVTIWQNNRYQMKRDWGYNQEHVINIRLENSLQFDVLKNVISQNPDVIKIAGTVHPLGQTQQQAVIEIAANKHEVINFDVGSGYLETLGIRLRKGRLFNQDLSTDYEGTLIVNELFLQEVGWENAIDQTVRFKNKIYTVIGVVEDFHYDNFFNEIRPVTFRLVPDDDLRYLTIRVQANKSVQSANAFQQNWQQLFPDIPYNSFFQDSVFESAFRNNMSITKIFAATAIITLVISCMGLFGLVTLMISKRSKEFSIHKVLGASVLQISHLITRRFILIVAASIIVALPGGYFFLNGLLDGVYRYRMPIGAFPFVLAGLVMLFTAILTIASQVYKSAVRNPIEAIRYE